ncbi:hypothetical protein J3D47_004171 [Pseudomonas laurylsulfativorans]|uniref:hypothetical protein n=1 Tax=Pseudomonas laurylsulfativorans TaxID=1943631 RepID=UPI0020A1A28A|nr:hypothetical protein [Pseudomonas laurylsulfativorans]MCP1419928.1 hypothetical protein [Pseudomonas laurylsulfativorans]
MVTLNRVPEIRAVVDSGTDWVTLFGFLLTALAVVTGTFYTSYTFRRAVESQERIARNSSEAIRAQSKSENLARSRQEWINSLRAEIASLLSISHDIYNLSDEVKDPKIRGVTESELLESWRRHNEKASEFYSLLAKARFHISNIQMHINPAEPESKELLKNIDLLISAAYESGKIYDLSVAIINVSQVILKKEWVRVKEMV